MRLIDAEALSDRLFAGFYPSYIRQIIDSMPTVEAKIVRHARWDYGEDEEVEVDENGNIQAYCTNCGAGDVHALRNKNKVPYCWKCGSSMYVEEVQG